MLIKMITGDKYFLRLSLVIGTFLSFLQNGGNCANVNFFSLQNYTDFLKEIDLKGINEMDCVNVSQLVVGSIKTERCLILYGNPNCQRSMHPITDFLFYGSIRVNRNEPDVPWLSNGHFFVPRTVSSFHVCSRSRGGGAEIDVDFYEHEDYKGSVVAQYRNVSGCKNLPRLAKGGKTKTISVDNHGNNVELFEGKNCKGKRKMLAAGYGPESRVVWRNGDFDVWSFRPQENFMPSH